MVSRCPECDSADIDWQDELQRVRHDELVRIGHCNDCGQRVSRPWGR